MKDWRWGDLSGTCGRSRHRSNQLKARKGKTEIVRMVSLMNFQKGFRYSLFGLFTSIDFQVGAGTVYDGVDFNLEKGENAVGPVPVYCPGSHIYFTFHF